MAAATDVNADLEKYWTLFRCVHTKLRTDRSGSGCAMPLRSQISSPVSYMLAKGLLDSPWVGFGLFREHEGDSMCHLQMRSRPKC